MFKTETHLHTAPVSACGRFSPREMIRFYHQAGYTTVCVSDHFAQHHFNKLGSQYSWDQKTDMLYHAYLEAKETGEQYGMHILFTPELSLDHNHYLLCGVDLAFLKLREDLFDLSLEAFYHHAKAYGITIVQAHPYRDGQCTPHPEFIDGVEVVNTNPRHENFDEACMELANKYGFPMSAGSDAHRTEDIARAAMISEKPVTSVQEYLSMLKNGEFRIMRNGEIL